MSFKQLFTFRSFALIGLLVSTVFLHEVQAQTTLFSLNSSTLQDYVVPAGVSTIKITAVGASGGGNTIAPAGTGGTVSAVFAVSAGNVIRSITGSSGLLQNNRGGGGGATGVVKFDDVTLANPVLLLVAGGGGGVASNVNPLGGESYLGKGAVTTAGSGNGGSGNLSAGGGGFLSNGGNATFPRGIGGKKADFFAITPGFESTGRGQGFGAGGPQNQIPRAGGGGGGYTGGNGVGTDMGGNGGSNFIAAFAADPVNTGGINGGATSVKNGSVLIETAASADPEILSATLPTDPQLLLNLSNPVNVPISGTFESGTGPHTITIDWGDGSSSVASVDETAETFTANHDYASTGVYIVKIDISDNAGGNGAQFIPDNQVMVYNHTCGQALMKPTYFDPISGKKVIIDAKVDYGSQTTFTSSSKLTFFHKTSPQFYFESNSITTLVTSGNTATIIVEGGVGAKGAGPFPTTHTLTMVGTDITPGTSGGAGNLESLVIEEIATGNIEYQLSAPQLGVPRITVNNAAGCRLGQPVTPEMSIATTVFPNPFDQSFVVEFAELPGSVVDLRVINAMGQEIISAQSDQLRTKISLDQAPAGIYFLQVRQGATVSTTKLVKE